jgi:hypothetical protein
MRELLEDMIERFYDSGLAMPVLRVAATGDETRPGVYRSAAQTGTRPERGMALSGAWWGQPACGDADQPHGGLC